MNHEILSVLRDDEIDIEAFFNTLSSGVQAHSLSVAHIAALLAGWAYEAGAEEAADLVDGRLERAARYHDIGFTLIPAELRDKTEELSAAEFRVLQRHALYGGQLLDRRRKAAAPGERDFWRLAAETAVSHHERWDGMGYPHRLLTSAIPFVSRVTAIADIYDSIVRGSPYQMPLPPEYAVLEVVSNAGKQFDPWLVEIFRTRCIGTQCTPLL